MSKEKVHELSIKEKAGYGFGDLASVLFWQMITAYLLFFYTDVFGITAAAAGTMILVSRLWDGINDPMMGMIADRTNTRWGKFRPYLIWMSIPLAIIAVLAFTTPDFGPTGKLIYAYITFILFMMAYTAINIPYSALMGVITSDSIERTSVASFKYAFAFAAGTIVSFFALPMAKKLGGGDLVPGFQRTMMVFGAVAVVFFFITFISTKERISPPPAQKTPIAQDLKDLFANKPWVILLVTTMMMILCFATRISITPHYFKYYVGTQDVNLFGKIRTFDFVTLTSWFNGINQALSVLAMLSTKLIARVLGKKKAFMTLFLITITTMALYLFLKPQHVIMMFVLQMVGSLSGAPLTPLIWGMYADTADHSEWKTGRRATGLVFSASTMSQKFGWAIGSAFAAWLLSIVGFQANVVPTQGVLNGLKALIGIVPAIAGGLAIVALTFYKLDEDTMKKVEADLNKRRKEGGKKAAATP
jgi:GPH family glycoside/pentoside/hexuronide:cation symporter